jgi:hypothetical protein
VRTYYFSTHGCDIGTSGAIGRRRARGRWWRVGGLLLRFSALRFWGLLSPDGFLDLNGHSRFTISFLVSQFRFLAKLDFCTLNLEPEHSLFFISSVHTKNINK